VTSPLDFKREYRC